MTQGEWEVMAILSTQSQRVGQSDGDGESKGHKSGRRIVEILGKNRSDYTEDDVEYMRRVVSYVHRH